MGNEVKRIVRIVSTDVPGHLSVVRALTRIKGVGFMFSRAICISTGIDHKKAIGLMNEEEIRKLGDAIKNPKLPQWILNRRKEKEKEKEGKLHAIGPELDLKNMEDINSLKHIRSYKGIRHELRLPVRGQRTRSTHRKGRTVGVIKKKEQPGKAKAKEEGK